MLSYCIRERKYTDSIPDSILHVETENNRIIVKSKCISCGAIKARFDKSITGFGNKDVDWSTQLANELHKPIRRNFPKRRVRVNGIDDIWSADLVDMQEFAKYNSGYKYLLNVIDIFSKYAWSVPVKDKTGNSIAEAFDKIIKSSHRKPIKLWVDQGSEFYNRVVDKMLNDCNIERYSTYNEGKAVVIERFNRTLKERMWKHFSAKNTNKYIDILQKLIEQYNNSEHSSIKMTPVEGSKIVNEIQTWHNLYGNIESLSKKTKFKVGDRVRISKYKRKVFDKGYTPNWTEEIFVIESIQQTDPITYKLKDLNDEPIEGSFYEPELQKTKQDKYRIERVIRKDKKKRLALVKWKGYSNNFNSWIPIEDLNNV
ncbi:TPA_asm: integrase [Trichoplax MELD virus]|nr:TPA_asm: integrase [Trichoplax MELD virus]